MINFDEYVAKAIIEKKYIKKNYPQYFAPEIRTFMDKNWFPKYIPIKTKACEFENDWVEEIKK